MPTIVPFSPGTPEQRIAITLDGEPYVLRARWNTSDDGLVGSWYLDAWERDGKTPIALGIKLVLGIKLGRSYDNPLFLSGLMMFDISDSGVEAGLFDFGVRVVLVHLTAGDVILSGALPVVASFATPP